MSDWAKHHPNAAAAEAFNSLDSKFMELMKDAHRKHGFPVSPKQFLSLGCVGYMIGVPAIYASDYTAATATEIREAPVSHQLLPGGFISLGQSAACQEITEKSRTTQLAKYKNHPTLVRYRKAASSGNLSGITTDDLLTISRVCLQATESAEGKAFDPIFGAGVGPPNQYFVIDERQGFRRVAPQ